MSSDNFVIIPASDNNRYRLLIDNTPSGVEIVLQEFCSIDIKSKHEGLKVLWGNRAIFKLTTDEQKSIS